MTRPVTLPTREGIQSALTQLRTEADRPVTARALAERVGLTNSTFWRHFPDIAQQVANDRRDRLRQTSETRSPELANQSDDHERRLRDENTALRAQLELAVAHIQRLTIENALLREQTESVAGIRHLPPP